ncbi:MAG: substrate-binding domain-containing protein [Bacteroidales bacterium]|nr:substrate-binding domain-containing protein [Candidatus Liminaster caballi]
MKSALYSLIALFGALILVSCGNDKNPQYLIGVSQCSSDAWRTKLNEEMRRELLFHPEIELEVRSADDDNTLQAADIDYFIAKGVDLLIVSPNEAAELTPAVSRAYDAGIPVIVADRNVTGEKYTAFVGGDNVEVGHLMGRYVHMVLPNGGKLIEILGLPGSTPAELRHQGFMEVLGSGYEIVQGVGNFFEQKAELVADSLFRLHPDVHMVVAQNDLMAIGARRAADRLLPGHNIIFMGVDGLSGQGNGIEAVSNGVIDASAVYATSGDLIIQTAVKILSGEPFERNTELATYLIDSGNAPLMNNIAKEVNHEVETVQMLKAKVDYYWEQHNLEQALLGTLLVFLTVFVIMLVVLMLQIKAKQRANLSLDRQRATLKEHRDQLKIQRDELERKNTQLTTLSHQVEDATRAKLTFFTNVSHDFRTPLTLISAPIENLLRSEKEPNRQKLLALANKNVQVLLRLINQILDFRKYESGKMELNLQNVDLREMVEAWQTSFDGLAIKKHIHMRLEVTDDDFRTRGDIAKLERVFFNLMGNAFKFTPENGRINVALARKDGNILLTVADNGPGVHVDKINKLFEDFYQFDSLHYEGSGLGLALVKSFTELHGGRVDVSNQSEGTGTVMTVTLPVVEQLADVEPANQEMAIKSEQVETELLTFEDNAAASYDDEKPVIVVVDDNSDIRQMLSIMLSDTYHVLTAASGQEGIAKSMRAVPNVIVCDVMMPGMDGLECCRRLKAEVNTSHIPVMMLTACSLDEQRVKGHEHGADAYLSKPFNEQVLRAQLDSLIKNHDRVRDFFSDELTSHHKSSAVSTPAVSIDDAFLLKVKQNIMKHLADTDYGIEQMGEEIGMSRAQLYRKVKALTNYSPVELVRNTRLKQAQAMLAQGENTIAEVAYSVGFSAPSYFTKCYKELFGENPIELVKRKG